MNHRSTLGFFIGIHSGLVQSDLRFRIQGFIRFEVEDLGV